MKLQIHTDNFEAEIAATISAKLSELLQSIDVAKSLVAAKAEVAAKLAEPFIGKSEAAEFLNMSVTTLARRMAEHDGPPRYANGRKVNFLKSELKAWRRQWRAGEQTGIT